MRTWHPDSWTVQARELADNFYSWDDKDHAFMSLRHSYRHPLIRLRACKRFGKLRRKNNIEISYKITKAYY